MLKRILPLLLVLALTLCLCVPASADSAVQETYTLEARDVVLNEDTNVLAVRKSGADGYVLMSPDGQELSDKTYLSIRARDKLFEVINEDGLNTTGVIDSQGNEVVPMQYGDIEYVSDRWTLGVVLEEATADNYDYKTLGGSAFYLVSAYDVYYNGAKVGSLARNEYENAYGYGSYLYVRNREGVWAFYDSAFNKSASEFDGSSEYEDDYKSKTVWHKGSNQQAFTAGCTLTPDDVEQSIWEKNGEFFDLQGNLLFTAARSYESIRDFTGDYAVVRFDGKYGLIDKQGHEVLPCEYDEISCSEAFLASGYQIVVKDGKAGYVNAQGQVTCDFTYGSSNVNTYRSPFTSLNDLEGNVIVLSGAVGELPERYKSATFVSSCDTCPVFAATNLEGNAGVVDLSGNAVIPFDGTYDNDYDFDISKDGAVIVARQGSGVYAVYLLSHQAPAAQPAVSQQESAGSEAEGWKCASCGTQNSGKFCTECGAAMPAETELACKACGYKPAEGETPKFCPECGASFAE